MHLLSDAFLSGFILTRGILMKKKSMGLVVFLSFVFILFLPTQASSFNTKETIKVGWYFESGFQEFDSQGNPCGYAYEYLEKLAGYQNLKITYVPASYEESLALIKTNSIDLMFQKPDETQNREAYLFSEKSISSMNLKLVSRKDNLFYAYKDYTNYNGMRVGIVRNEAIKYQTLDYATRNSIHITLIEYESINEVTLALNKKKIDSMVLSTLQNNENFRLLDEFSFSPLHLLVDINNVKLKNQVDSGISKIDHYQSNFKIDLMQKYYKKNQDGGLILSKSEALYIKENPVLDVYIGPDWYPVIYQNNNKDKRGIFIDFLEYITDETGLQFHYIKYDNYAQVLDSQGYRMNKSISITNGNFPADKTYNVQLSEPFFSTNIIKVTANSRTDKIALPIGVSYSQEITDQFKGIEVIYFQSMRECLDALDSNQASMTFMNAYEAEYYLKQPPYHNFNTTIEPNQNMNFYFSASSSCSVEARSILEKAFSSISEKEWNHILKMNTTLYQKSSIHHFFSLYMPYFISGCILSFLVLIFTIFCFLRSRKHVGTLTKQNKRLKEKNYFSNYKYREYKIPIEAIAGWTKQALVSNEHKSREIEECLRKINIVSQYTNDLLTIEKHENHKNNDFSDSEYGVTYERNFISSILTIVQYEADKKGIQIVSTINSENKECIMMNRVQTSQALINILYNAIKFSNRGSQVEFILNVTDNEETKKIKHVYEIIDHGVGISPSKLPELFNMVKDTESNEDSEQIFNSTGYGLECSKRYIEAMGGSILVESTLGKGTVFTIILTFECAKEHTMIIEEKNNPYYQLLKGKRILFAQENPLDSFTFTNQLEKLGVAIETVEDGQQVMGRYIQSKKGYYDLLLLNLHLPVMNAFEIASEIRRLKREDASSIPIICISTKPLETDILTQCKNAGLNDYLEEPINMDELIQKIIFYVGPIKS